MSGSVHSRIACGSVTNSSTAIISRPKIHLIGSHRKPRQQLRLHQSQRGQKPGHNHRHSDRLISQVVCVVALMNLALVVAVCRIRRQHRLVYAQFQQQQRRRHLRLLRRLAVEWLHQPAGLVPAQKQPASQHRRPKDSRRPSRANGQRTTIPPSTLPVQS